MYLKANGDSSETAWNFYTKRGFRALPKSPTFPSLLIDAFANEVDTSPLHNYLGDSKDLTWLLGTFGSTSFFEHKNEPVNTRLFSNPNPIENDWHSVYARLPGKLSLNDIEHCAPDIKSGAAAVLKKSSTAEKLLEL